MISDDARAQMEANRTRGQRWLAGEDVELVDRTQQSPRRIVLLREVQPGVEVWAFDGGRRDHHAEPLGGYVVAVEPGWTGLDPDTGEITERPARFRTYDPLVAPLAKAFRTLDADQVDETKITIPEDTDLGRAVRRFAAGVCGHDRRFPPGRLNHAEAQLILDAAALVRAAMYGR